MEMSDNDKINKCLHELDALRSNVGGLECADRQICSLVDGLRAALEAALDRIEALERTVEPLR